jgi:hypothetical protein
LHFESRIKITVYREPPVCVFAGQVPYCGIGAESAGVLERIYSLELTEIKKLSEKGSTKPNSQYYTDSVNNLQQKHDKIKRFMKKMQIFQFLLYGRGVGIFQEISVIRK